MQCSATKALATPTLRTFHTSNAKFRLPHYRWAGVDCEWKSICDRLVTTTKIIVELSSVLCFSSCRLSHCGRDQYSIITAQGLRTCESDSSTMQSWYSDAQLLCRKQPAFQHTWQSKTRRQRNVCLWLRQSLRLWDTCRAAVRRRVRVLLVRSSRSPNPNTRANAAGTDRGRLAGAVPTAKFCSYTHFHPRGSD